MERREFVNSSESPDIVESTIVTFAQFAEKSRFEYLPAEVVEDSKRLILDSVACALGGATSDKGKAGLAFARNFSGCPEVTVIGFGDKMSVLGATFANGELINALDWDAILVPGHVTPFMFPAYLAAGESLGASGKDLILATALSHEISHRIGKNMATYRDIRDGKVIFPPVMGYSCSIFGGVAGVGKIKGFEKKHLASALGIAGHIAPAPAMTSWVKDVPSTTCKYLLAGWAAQACITAAMLAELGHRGDLQILDSEFGFWRYMGSSQWEPTSAVRELGKKWLFTSVQNYKPYPHCRILHGSLDCLKCIIDENDIKPEEIEHIKAWIEHFGMEPVWDNRVVNCQVDAQFSVAHGLALAAHGIPPGPEWQDYSTIMNPSIQALMNKVTYELHPRYIEELDKDARSRLAKVEVKARNKLFTEERLYPKGAPSPISDTFMTTDELAGKFRNAAQRILPLYKMDDAINAILELEKIKDISKLIQLISI